MTASAVATSLRPWWNTSSWATVGVVLGTPLDVVGRRYVALLEQVG